MQGDVSSYFPNDAGSSRGLADAEKEDRNEISNKGKHQWVIARVQLRGLLCMAVGPAACRLYVSVHECVRGDLKQKQSVTLRIGNRTPEWPRKPPDL